MKLMKKLMAVPLFVAMTMPAAAAVYQVGQNNYSDGYEIVLHNDYSRTAYCAVRGKNNPNVVRFKIDPFSNFNLFVDGGGEVFWACQYAI